MQRVTITRTSPKSSPEGAAKPWKKLGIQTQEYGDQWLGCFYPGDKYPNKTLTATLDSLKEGSVVDIVVTKSPDGKYLNFTLPTKTDKLESRIEAIEKQLGIIPGRAPAAATQTPSRYDEYGASDLINPDDIPF